jgi:hypothetical protein
VVVLNQTESVKLVKLRIDEFPIFIGLLLVKTRLPLFKLLYEGNADPDCDPFKPFPLKSFHVVEPDVYDLGFAASNAKTNPSVTILDPPIVAILIQVKTRF